MSEPLLQLEDLGARLHAEGGIEVRERLVHQECLGLAHDRPAERDTLALPAGELLGLPLQHGVELERLRSALDAAVDLRLRQLLVSQAEGQVVVHGHVRIERIRLEDHGDVARSRRDVVHDPVADEDPAARDLLEAGEHPERRRLAAAGRPDEHEELAVLDLDHEIVDRARLVELLRNVVERDGCHQGRASEVDRGSAKCAAAMKV